MTTSRPTICVRCGWRLPTPAVAHNDPHCSRKCAELSYGTFGRSWLDSPHHPYRSLLPKEIRP